MFWSVLVQVELSYYRPDDGKATTESMAWVKSHLRSQRKIIIMKTNRRTPGNVDVFIKCYVCRRDSRAKTHTHYSDVIMSRMASQITSLTIVYSTIDQRKHQRPASLAFVRGIHRWPVNSPHKGPVTGKMFPFDDVIMWFDFVPHRYTLLAAWISPQYWFLRNRFKIDLCSWARIEWLALLIFHIIISVPRDLY